MDNNEKQIISLLANLGVKIDDIVSLLSEAKENTPSNWQEEVFYIFKERLEDEEGLTQAVETHHYSELWQNISKLDTKKKLPFLLQRVLGWSSDQIARLYHISVTEADQRIVSALEEINGSKNLG